MFAQTKALCAFLLPHIVLRSLLHCCHHLFQVSTNFIDRVVKAYKRFTLAHASRQFKIARDDKKFQLTMDGSTTMKTMDPKIKDAVSKAKTCEEWVMAQGWKKQNEWSHTETPAAVYSTFDALIKSLKKT